MLAVVIISVLSAAAAAVAGTCDMGCGNRSIQQQDQLESAGSKTGTLKETEATNPLYSPSNDLFMFLKAG